VFWIFIGLVVAIALLSLIASVVGALISPQAGTMVLIIGYGLIGAAALWDGTMRLAQRQGLLGGGTRMARAAAVVQVILALVVLLSALNALITGQTPFIPGQ
jgi:spore maturation protein SpmA